MIIRSKAPLRISFGGGGTDVSPYPEDIGGVALNVTIDKYAYCTISTRDDKFIKVYSQDLNQKAKYNMSIHGEPIVHYNGKLDLAKAAINVMEPGTGLNLFMHSDALPGSGLGTSSTMVVALVGALRHLMTMPLTDYEIAELAYDIERIELELAGGRQDQYAAVFGGFNFMEFQEYTIVNPLKIKRETINELAYRLLLCYTGRTRKSADIIKEQTRSYVDRCPVVTRALDRSKEQAIDMKKALLLGKIDVLGGLLHDAWQSKKEFSDKVTSPKIDELYAAAIKNGALGGKLLGAGGGGYLLLLCEFDKRHKVADKLSQLGGQIEQFAFDYKGLQTWEVR